MRRPRALLLALALLGLAAPASGQQSLTPDAFLALAQGRTLTFSDAATGELVGTERFLPGGRTVWARADGSCAYGTITIEGPEICFVYDDDAPDQGPHCWWPMREGLRLYVRLADARRHEVQQITAMGDEPLACEAVPTA